jgi:hypothetical protein
MKTFVAVALMGAVSFATRMDAEDFEFIRWVAKFGKSYGTKEEYAFRLQQFKRIHRGI